MKTWEEWDSRQVSRRGNINRYDAGARKGNSDDSGRYGTQKRPRYSQEEWDIHNAKKGISHSPNKIIPYILFCGQGRGRFYLFLSFELKYGLLRCLVIIKSIFFFSC